MNDLFIAFTGKDAGPAGTPQPGTVKRQYSAFPRTFTVDTFTHVWFCSSCTAYRNRGRSTISNDCISAAPSFIRSIFCSPISCRQSSHVVCIANATSYWPPLAYSITVVAVRLHLTASAFSNLSYSVPFQSTIDETGTCCLLAGPTPIAEIGKAPEVPRPSKTCCLHESFEYTVKSVVFNINIVWYSMEQSTQYLWIWYDFSHKRQKRFFCSFKQVLLRSTSMF